MTLVGSVIILGARSRNDPRTINVTKTLSSTKSRSSYANTVRTNKDGYLKSMRMLITKRYQSNCVSISDGDDAITDVSCLDFQYKSRVWTTRQSDTLVNATDHFYRRRRRRNYVHVVSKKQRMENDEMLL